MKKLLFCLLVLAGTGVWSSCQQDEVMNEAPATTRGVTIRATLPGDDAPSRVILGDTQGATTKMYWEADDEITLVIDGEIHTFAISNYAENQTVAQFVYTGDEPLSLPEGEHTFMYGIMPRMNQAGTKEALSDHHYMTATFTATAETAWSDVSLHFTTQVAIVEISLGSTADVTGVSLYDAAEDKLLASASGTFADNKVYFAVPAGTYTGHVMAQAGDKFYEATVGENTLQVGHLYRIREELAEWTPTPPAEGVEAKAIGSTAMVYGTGAMTATFQENIGITHVKIMEGVTSISENAFYNCISLTSVEIPASVTTIGDEAFDNCIALETVTFGENSQLTTIGASAFEHCESLTSIDIPDGVTSIGASAFSACESLTSIDIPDGVITIGENAFNMCCSLTSIDIPDGVTSIGASAFSACESLTSIDIPDGVITIGENAFNRCESLTSVDIPDGVTAIEAGVFSYCKNLESVVIPDGVTSIGYGAFQRCESLTSVDIPAGVTTIEATAFSACYSLTSVDIPAGVTIITSSVFSGTGLTSIEIPEDVVTIDYHAFRECTGLAAVTCYAVTPPELRDYAFMDNADGRIIYVPAESVDAYKKAAGWSTYADAIVSIPANP